MNDLASRKRRVFSGVQPTGKVHIGNYVGALSVWAENQDQFENIFCVVDMHALTIPEAIQPQVLRDKTREVAALYVACGIDPQKSTIFVQSDVPAHAELAWILNCVTPLGWLRRMTQFKSKSRSVENIGTGLLDYPVLQAADILLYLTDLVPVGEDQKQHVELTRDIALRFNNLFGEVFVIAEPLIRTSGARIMAFDDPTQKMSKSEGEKKSGHSIGMLDPPERTRETIMKAVTDSGSETRYDHAEPGVKNLLVLYEALTKESKEQIDARFAGKGYGFLKREVADLVVSVLTPIQAKYAEIRSERSYLDKILRDGAQRARELAAPVLAKAKDAVGFGY